MGDGKEVLIGSKANMLLPKCAPPQLKPMEMNKEFKQGK